MTTMPNDLSAFWMPFTDNRGFKAEPRLLARAKDMHYWTPDGRQLYVTQPGRGEVTVLDAGTRAVLRVVNVGGDPRRVRFDAIGLTAVVTDQAGQVTFIR